MITIQGGWDRKTSNFSFVFWSHYISPGPTGPPGRKVSSASYNPRLRKMFAEGEAAPAAAAAPPAAALRGP